MKYTLLDSGNEKKLESFGEYKIIRPCLQAIWKPQLAKEVWNEAKVSFSREKNQNWTGKKMVPKEWVIQFSDMAFSLSLTDFGHLGIFPEHAFLWDFLRKNLVKPGLKVLNLFAYTGGATIALLQKKAFVCHVDASKPVLEWTKKNVKLNDVDQKSARFLLDDAMKFVKREVRRSSLYDGIIMDPPSFGRGPKNEVFKIERDLVSLVEYGKSLLSKKAQFFILSCHTPGYTSKVLEQVLQQVFYKKRGVIFSGDMHLKPKQKEGFIIPSGCYAIWTSDANYKL